MNNYATIDPIADAIDPDNEVAECKPDDLRRAVVMLRKLPDIEAERDQLRAEVQALRACLAEADRLMDHCDEPTDWRDRWQALLSTTPPANRVEVIIWQPASSPPDDDRTVLLHHPITEFNAAGYYDHRDGGRWHDQDGFLHGAGDVLHWAPMPKGPAT